MTSTEEIQSKEPEVFETEDVIEQPVVQPVEKIGEHLVDALDSSRPTLQDARGKFVSKNLDTSRQDYSESIVSLRRRRQLFQKNQPEYEMLGEEKEEEKKETNLQKFNRLQYEITSFINQISDSHFDKDKEENETGAISMGEELSLLKQQLENLAKNEGTAGIVNPKMDVKQSANLQSALSQKLYQQIAALVSHSNVSSSSNSKTDSSSALDSSQNSSLIYELYFSPSHNKLKEISKAADVEQRIALLEQLVGGKTSNSTGLGKPLAETVDQLKEKVDSFSSPSSIAELQKNMQVFTHQIEVALEKKKALSNIAPAINEQKINELFDLVNKWDVTSQQLPSVVQRLQSLRFLHEQSVSFVNSIQQLETQQEDLKQLLKSNNEIATKLEGNFSSNMNIIQSNVASLERRFDELKKKLEDMGLETF